MNKQSLLKIAKKQVFIKTALVSLAVIPFVLSILVLSAIPLCYYLSIMTPSVSNSVFDNLLAVLLEFMSAIPLYICFGYLILLLGYLAHWFTHLKEVDLADYELLQIRSNKFPVIKQIPSNQTTCAV